MSDVKHINIDGVSYDIADEKARQDIEGVKKAQANSMTVTYESSSQTVKFSKGSGN